MVKGDKSLIIPNPHTYCNKFTPLDYIGAEDIILWKILFNKICRKYAEKSIFHNWKFYLALLVFLDFLEAISFFGET
jgi:hypothetical protein